MISITFPVHTTSLYSFYTQLFLLTSITTKISMRAFRSIVVFASIAMTMATQVGFPQSIEKRRAERGGVLMMEK